MTAARFARPTSRPPTRSAGPTSATVDLVQGLGPPLPALGADVDDPGRLPGAGLVAPLQLVDLELDDALGHGIVTDGHVSGVNGPAARI